MSLAVGPLQAMVRNASGDGTVRVRLGTANCYCPRTHRVELAEQDLAERSREEVLAVAAHEGAHARLTLYDEQLPPEITEDPLQMRAANVLEDARIDAWVVHAFPGLSKGQKRMHDRAFASDADLEELGQIPRCWRFVWDLRAAAVGRKRKTDPDPLVRRAVHDCLAAARLAVDAWPRDRFGESGTIRRLSASFCAQLEARILPAFRALLAKDREEAASPSEALKLEETLARIGDIDIDGTWAKWVPGGQERSGAVPPSWSGRLRDLGALLGAFTTRLERLLRPNALHRYVGRQRSGPRLDLRRAMAWEAGGSAEGLFMRRVDPKDPVYRVVVVADLSSSMLGGRMDAMGNAVVLTTEACERLGLPSAVVVFGTRHEQNVKVLKELDEDLGHRRAELARMLIEKPPVGSETPLAEALDRARAVLGPPPDEGHDLVLVVTDGRPRSSHARFYAQPTDFTCTNDSGVKTGESRHSGRVIVLRTERDEQDRVDRAIAALSGPGRTILGVGIGDDAPVEAFFEHARAFEDHEAFAKHFPSLLEEALRELVV